MGQPNFSSAMLKTRQNSQQWSSKLSYRSEAPNSANSSIRRKREEKLVGKQMIAGIAVSQKHDKTMNYFDTSDLEQARDDENTQTNVNDSSMSMSLKANG